MPSVANVHAFFAFIRMGGAGARGKHPPSAACLKQTHELAVLCPESKQTTYAAAVFDRDVGFEATNQQLPGFSPGGHAVLSVAL